MRPFLSVAVERRVAAVRVMGDVGDVMVARRAESRGLWFYYYISLRGSRIRCKKFIE